MLSFPVHIQALYVGRAGSSGEFTDSATGEKVSYTEAHAFDFDDAEGNVQRLTLRANKIDAVSKDFDLGSAKRYADHVTILGDVVLNQDGGRSFFKPHQITKTPAQKAA